MGLVALCLNQQENGAERQMLAKLRKETQAETGLSEPLGPSRALD